MRNKRVLVTRYGGPEVISVIEGDIPTPKTGEIRVKVLAAGVSLPDVLAREGVHPETPKVPYTPGWDLVGTVDQVGQGVVGFEPGQTVTASGNPGDFPRVPRTMPSLPRTGLQSRLS
jgi:NADPH2:quinone reductase